MIIAMKFITIVLDRCLNKPLIIVNRGPWHSYVSNRLGIEYIHKRFGKRSIVERFSVYLKQRTRRFYNNIKTWKIWSIEDYISTIAIIKTYSQ
jgi:transposase-like protein